MKKIFYAILFSIISSTVWAQEKQIDKFEYNGFQFKVFETTEDFALRQVANDGSGKIIKEHKPVKRIMYKVCGYKKDGQEINCIKEVKEDDEHIATYSRERDFMAFVKNYKKNTDNDKNKYRLFQYLILRSGKIASVSSNYGMVKYFDNYPATNTFEAQFLKTELSLLEWKTNNLKYRDFLFNELMDDRKVISFEIEINIDERGIVQNEFFTFLSNNKAISAPILKKLQLLIAPKIAKMPDWIPARKNGINTASTQTLDITIFPENSSTEAVSN